MISQYAISEIDDLIKDGLQPSPSDIIRLNALGLKVDHGIDDSPLYTRRRAARLGSAWIREPTIAHHIFMADCRSLLPDGGRVGRAVLRAWVMSLDKPPAEPPADISAVIDTFIKDRLLDVTLDQIEVAVEFCLYGYDSSALEFPPNHVSQAGSDSDKLETADDTSQTDAFSFEIGLVRACETIGLGISLADALKHTRAQLHAVYDRALEKRADMSAPEVRAAFYHERKNRWIVDFNAAVDEIAARLRAEKSSQEGKTKKQ